MKNRFGRFNKEELDFLHRGQPDYTIDELAKMLKRDPKTVADFMSRNKLIYKGCEVEDIGSEDRAILDNLMNKPFYKGVVSQLSNEELERFKDTWIQVIKQYELNIKATEEVQLKQLILLDMNIDRIKIERQEATMRLEEIKTELKSLLKEPRELRDEHKINIMTEEQGWLRASFKDNDRRYKDLLSEWKNVQSMLSGSRSERLKQIGDSSQSWPRYLDMLDEQQYRKLAGQDAEAMNMARDKSMNKLAEYHEYADGKVDRPILSAETILRVDDE